jgi:hypothetical protein
MAKERQVGTTNYADVLRDDEWDDLARLYEETEAAPDPEPIPAGDYKARLVGGKMIRSTEKGTRGFRLGFEIVEGEYSGRRVWDTSWLTREAMPTTKRKLAPLGINSLDRLREPLPENLFCTLKVTVRREDDGSLWNRVLTISDVVRRADYSRAVDEDFKEETERVRHTGVRA